MPISRTDPVATATAAAISHSPTGLAAGERETGGGTGRRVRPRQGALPLRGGLPPLS
ncbi:MAG: hypothetical protein HY784_05740 [Chloroflexi bacterium]|nr:hypothetical protein [Chloroflexota bacterium]